MITHSGIATTIFSGFLGSGKTTIIGHLLDHLQKNGKQSVYIKNEIGSENIDNQLLAGKGIVSKELLNGCICCTLVGPFSSAIDEVIASFQPDHILIEASGAADPSAIALMISNHPKLYRDGVISIIDVLNFKGYSDLSATARRQAQFTDLIIFNKTELVSTEDKKAVVGYVREFNEFAPIIEAPLGRVDPAVIFGVSTQELAQLLEEKPVHEHSQHLKTDGIETFHLSHSGTTSSEKVAQFLQLLPNNYFRVKALFVTEDAQTFVAHKVGLRVDITPFPKHNDSADNKDPLGTFVFIGFSITQTQEKVSQEFATLFTPSDNS
jgi:G3E family GTPase